jgi:hypothetical protein
MLVLEKKHDEAYGGHGKWYGGEEVRVRQSTGTPQIKDLADNRSSEP